MLPQNRYRWFYRIVRHNTQRIDEETAAKYKFRLAAVYVVSAFGIFCMATTMRDKDKAEKRKKYGNDEFEGKYHINLIKFMQNICNAAAAMIKDVHHERQGNLVLPSRIHRQNSHLLHFSQSSPTL